MSENQFTLLTRSKKMCIEDAIVNKIQFIGDIPMGNLQAASPEAALGSDGLPQHGFLFIGELAKLTGTDPKTIRFYERADLISPPRHGRFRTYLASDVRRLKNILTLRRLGVPIAQIRTILDTLLPEEDVLASAKAVSLLKQHLDLLKSRQDEISQQIEKTHSALHELVA
jgi:DNA-binding transcriptional MerR regulator